MAKEKIPAEGMERVLAEAGLTKSFTISLDAEVAQRIAELAKGERCSPEKLMAQVLERYSKPASRRPMNIRPKV